MTDSIEIDLIYSTSAGPPSLDRIGRLGDESDEYRTSGPRYESVSLSSETDDGYPFVTGIEVDDADSDWPTLPSMPAIIMFVLTSDLDASPDLEATIREVLDRVAFVYQSVDGCQYAYGLDVQHLMRLGKDAGPDIPVSRESLAENRIEWVSWLMLFSPEMVEEYGREWLLSAPAWERRELDDGAILLVTTPDPTDWNTAPQARQDLADYFELPE